MFKLSLITLLFGIPNTKNNLMSSDASVTMASKYFCISTAHGSISTYPHEAEAKFLREWETAVKPEMEKIKTKLEKNIDSIFKMLKIDALPYNESYNGIWEETIDKDAIKRYRENSLASKSNSNINYGIRCWGIDINKKEREQAEKKIPYNFSLTPKVQMLYIAISMSSLPNDSTLGKLKALLIQTINE